MTTTVSKKNKFPGESFLRVQMNPEVFPVFTHPNLTRLNGVTFPPLPEDLKDLDKRESDLQAMSYQELDDACEWLNDPEFGLDHATNPWIIMYSAYRNSSQMNERKSWNEASVTPVTEEKPVLAEVPTVALTPIQLAASDSTFTDIVEDRLLDISHNTSMTDDLVLAIAAYVAADGLDNNKSHDELARLAHKAKMWGVFKLVGQVKNDPRFLDLVASHTPDLVVSGGNERGSVVAVGKTAQEVLTPIKEDWLSKLPVVTDTPEDLLNAHGLTKTGKPKKGQKTKDAIAAKKEKAAKKAESAKGGKKEKAPKKEKVAKAKPVLPMPTIADIATLEAMDRKALQAAMSAVNSNKKTDTKGNGTSEAIKVALAKELLGIEGYVPAAKPEKVKGAKAPEAPIAIPDGISWEEVKGMSYRQLQGFCKVLRSNGLFEGNVGGAGSAKVILLEKAAEAMRKLGHDVVSVQVSPQNPDTATPTLERKGVKYDLMCQATDLLAA